MAQDITYQNHDVLFKILSDMYRDIALDMYGLEKLKLPRIKDILPNNFPEIKADEKRSDTVFLLEDGSILLLEYESNNRINENMYKYIDYVLRIGNKYFYEKQIVKNIKVVVIYSSDIIVAPEKFDTGSLVLNTFTVFMHEYNRKEIYEYLKKKIRNKEELTHKDMMNLILLPYMKKEYNEDIQILIKEDIELAKEIEEEKTQVFVIAGLLTAVNKYIDSDYSEEVRRWLKMTAVERIYEREKQEALGEVQKIYEREKQEALGEVQKKYEKEKDEAQRKYEAEKLEKEKAINTVKEMAIDSIGAKFESIPIGVINTINSLNDIDTIKKISKLLLSCDTIDNFKEKLNELVNMK